MELSTLAIILGVLAIIAIVGWLFRSMIKLVFVVIFIYLLFHIGYVWGFDEMNKVFHLDRFLKPEVSEQIATQYDTLEQKREEFGVVQTDEMKRVMDEALLKAWDEAGQKYSSIDKEALLKELKEKLASYSQEEVDQALSETELLVDSMSEQETETQPQ